jgi:hypothetical protein
VNYLSARPASRIGQGNVYLATTAQAYPRVNAWNTMVEIASETVSAILSDLARRPAPAAKELVNA